MKTFKNVILYIIFGIIGLGVVLGIPYYIVLNNHDFYLNTDKVTLGDGNEYQIDLKPKDGSKFDIDDYVFESENPNIAEVSEDGKVIAKGKGTTTIKIKYKYSLFSKKLTITVTEEIIEIEKITLNKTKETIKVGDSITLKATITPSNATEKSLTWTSSNENVAFVDDTGEVIGLSKGTTIITVKTVNKKVAKATIIVKEEQQQQQQKPQQQEPEKPKEITVRSVTLNKKEARISVGEQYQLKATVNPSNAKNKSVTWSSSNASVAKVDKSGLVTGIKNGTATITVKTSNGKTATCKIIVKNEVVNVTGITLDKTSETIGIGESTQLTETIIPSNATNQTVTWSSSDTSVATVSNTGFVTGKKAGTTTITVKTNNGKTATCKITVKKSIVEVTGVTLDKTTGSISVGKTLQLNETITPADATNQKVTWSSSDTSVATVSSTGLVTGKKAGTTTITVKTNNGKTATCKITIKSTTIAVTRVTLNKTAENLNIGKTLQLTAKISPSNATDKTIKWTSINPSIATVNSNGLVTAKKVGTTTIIAKANNGIKATCNITVKAVIVEVTGITLNKTTDGILVGKTSQLSATVSPSNATNKIVTWISSNQNVATVSNTGLVTGKNPGTVTITAKTNNGKTATCKVTVSKKAIAVTSIKIDQKNSTIKVNKTLQLSTTVTPKNATNQTVTWTSSNTGVATVSSTGLVTGKKVGTTTITAKSNNGKTSSIKIKVEKINDTVTITTTSSEYTGNEIIPTTKATSNTKVTLTYYSDSKCKTKTSTPKNAGTYYAIGKSAGNGTYNSGTSACTKAVVITKKADKVTINTKTSAYTGNEIKASAKAESGTKVTITYYSDSSCKTKTTTPKKVGTYYAIGKSAGNKNYKSGTSACTKAVVISNVEVTGITLSQNAATIKINKTLQLTATIIPSNAANKTVTWTSSDTSVANVSSKGLVTAKKEGTATITAKTNNGKTATCIVTVSKVTVAVTSIKINQKDSTIKIKKTLQLTATISPSNATDQSIKWSSNNTTVATVSNNGLVTAKKVGNAKITATSSNKKTSTITIKVEKSNDTVTITTKTAEYTGNTITPTIKATSGSKITTTYYSDSACKKTTTTPKSIGTYYAIAKSAGNSDYNSGTSGCVKAVVITKKTDKVTITLKTVKYTGNGVAGTATATSGSQITFTYYSDSSCKKKTSTPKNMGTYYAIAKSAGSSTYNSGTSACTKAVVITKPPVTALSLKPQSVVIEVGGNASLTVTVTPSILKGEKLTWTSSDSNIVTVDGNGKLTGKKAGTAKITVKASNGVSANSNVTVQNAEVTTPTNPRVLEQRNKAVVKYFTKSVSIKSAYKDSGCNKNGFKCDQPVIYSTKLTGNIELYSYNNGSKKLIGTYKTDMIPYYLIPGNTYLLKSKSTGKEEYVKVNSGIRMIYAPSIRNIRDLGGWSADGGTVKYGKIFRSANPNGAKANSDTLKKDEAIFKSVGVKVIVDLRSQDEFNKAKNKYKDFEKYDYAIKQYDLNDSKKVDQRKAVRKIMESVVNGKGVIFHCAVGTDRTGTVAYLLEGILGVNSTNRAQDYEQSYLYREESGKGLTRDSAGYKTLKNEIEKYSTNGKEQERFMNWFLAKSSDKKKDMQLINDFRKAMINGNPTVYVVNSNGKVEKQRSITSVTLNKTSATIFKDDSVTLTATISPSNANISKSLTWTSSDTSVATVKDGKVVGKKEGTATITVKTSNGKTATFKLKVKNRISFSWKNGKEVKFDGGAGRIYALPNNTLVAGYESGKNIYAVTSSDNGKTWSKAVNASYVDKNNTTCKQADRDCANVNFYYYNGKLYLAYRAVKKSGGSALTALHVSVSSDYGKTWKYHSTIANRTNYCKTGCGYWEPFLGTMNGKLTVLYATDAYFSNDSRKYQNIDSKYWTGTKWSDAVTISQGSSHNSRDGMPSWTQLSNGYYVLVIESSKYDGASGDNKHPFVIQLLYSKDGKSWSNPVDVYIPKGKGKKAAAPGIVELSTGQIVVSFQTDEDSSENGDDNSYAKTIYSDGTGITKINKSNFSKAENVLKKGRGTWSGIHYKNGYLYFAGGTKGKILYVG